MGPVSKISKVAHICSYIYIYRERERGRESERQRVNNEARKREVLMT